MENRNEQTEKNLMEMIRQKEAADRRLLNAEIYIGVLGAIVGFVPIFAAAYAPMADWMRGVLIAAGLGAFMICVCFALSIEQKAGYYECGRCGHRYVPTYRSVFLAMHVNRTRYMKCPECGERSWQKKKIGRN